MDRLRKKVDKAILRLAFDPENAIREFLYIGWSRIRNKELIESGLLRKYRKGEIQ